jgi:hypothetical protein
LQNTKKVKSAIRKSIECGDKKIEKLIEFKDFGLHNKTKHNNDAN